MSYILDALRKSDQQRQRGTAPTLQTPQIMPPSREPRTRWLYPSLAVAVAATAFALGWLRPWQPAQTATRDPTPPADSKVAVATPAEAPAPPQAVHETPPKPHSAPARMETPAARAQAPERKDPVHRAPAQPPATAPAAPAPAPEARPAAAVKARKPAEERIPTIAELPASVREQLPPMTITVHAYSAAPKERLLAVNGKLLREGDALAPDLVLESITPDGMIFSYMGTRFQRGVR